MLHQVHRKKCIIRKKNVRTRKREINRNERVGSRVKLWRAVSICTRCIVSVTTDCKSDGMGQTTIGVQEGSEDPQYSMASVG